MSNLIGVNSAVRLNLPKIRQLMDAQITALEETAEAVHTEIVQAQVFPRDSGNLQNESTFVDRSQSKSGKASIVSSTPYARRLYFHPEYHFDTGENPNARGRWYEDWIPGGKEADFATDTFKEIYRRLWTSGIIQWRLDDGRIIKKENIMVRKYRASCTYLPDGERRTDLEL